MLELLLPLLALVPIGIFIRTVGHRVKKYRDDEYRRRTSNDDNPTEGELSADERKHLCEEYDILHRLELETTKFRYTTFTAILGISMLLPGLAARAEMRDLAVTVAPFSSGELPRYVFLLGFFFYCFGILHYWWYHRYSHAYRDRLKKIEDRLGFQIYNLRVRPKFALHDGVAKLHFDWAIAILGLAYGAITTMVVGPMIFVVAVWLVVSIYAILMWWSREARPEPTEPPGPHNEPGQ